MFRNRVEETIDAYVAKAEKHNVVVFGRLFNTHHMAEGIKRAKDYKASLSAYHTDADLVPKVYFDVLEQLGKGPLDTSTELREKLRDALFAQLGVTKKTISETESKAAANAVVYGSTASIGAVVITRAVESALLGLLNNAMRENGYSIQKVDANATEMLTAKKNS